MVDIKKIVNIIIISLFVVGIGLVSYSVYQMKHGEKLVNEALEEAERAIQQGPKEPPPLLTPEPDNDDESKEEEEDQETSPVNSLGILHVPKLGQNLPIVEGVERIDLAQGVGHYPGTALPTQDEQIVLSGHNDTVFRNFDKLEIGDTFVVKLSYGTFEYEIYETDIVSADDLTVIRPRGEEILTVTTCYPFVYIGDPPDRFIFYAKPVDSSESNEA